MGYIHGKYSRMYKELENDNRTKQTHIIEYGMKYLLVLWY